MYTYYYYAMFVRYTPLAYCLLVSHWFGTICKHIRLLVLQLAVRTGKEKKSLLIRSRVKEKKKEKKECCSHENLAPVFSYRYIYTCIHTYIIYTI